MQKILRTLLDCVLASFLWLLCAVPVVTVGAASTALYHTVHTVIRRDEGRVWTEFRAAFKSNFKQATLVWLIALPVLAFVLAGGYNAFILYRLEIVSGILPLAIACVLIGVILWVCYLFPCIARFENTLGQMLKNCGMFVLLHPLWSAVLLLVFLGEAAVALTVPGLFPLVPAFGTLLSSYPLERVFGKYGSESPENEN